MKRIIAVLLPLLSSLCFGQALSYTPPSAAAYISPSAGVWNAWTSAAAFGALGYTPPSVGLYCQASAGAQWTPCAPSAGGGGTVTSISVVTANGVSGAVATPTTTPAITLTLGAITPTSVAATGAVSGNQFAFVGDLTTKLTNAAAVGTLLFQSQGTNSFFWTGNEQRMTSADTMRWVNTNDVTSGLIDTSFGKLAAGSFYFGNGAVGDVTAILNGGRFISSVATGTAPITVASTTPVANLTVSNHPTVQYCGITAACSATAITNGQIVFGSAVLDGGTPTSQVTITGVSPVFADTAYICTVNSKKNTPTTVVLSVNNITTSSFQIVGTALATDTVGYICVH